MSKSGGASKASEPLSQPPSERTASPAHSDEDDSDDEILETSANGRYQKMIEQVSDYLPLSLGDVGSRMVH